MFELAKILLAQAKERGAVELGIAADVIVGVRVERLAVLVEPALLSVVARLHVDGERAPILRLAADVITALDQENSLARRREAVSERPASRAGPNDDDVKMVVGCHGE